MRIWHALAWTAVLMSLSHAAFTQAPPAQQTAGQQAPAVGQPAEPEGAAIRNFLIGAKQYRWVRITPEGMATLTFDPSGRFESFALISRSPLMPRGAQTQCSGDWRVSGRSITIFKRMCSVGQALSEQNPDYIAEVVTIDAETLVLRLEEGAIFEFKAQH